jgi:peptidoglycan/xylan/chitin deacetylase (PgdA/CDA1 family)
LRRGINVVYTHYVGDAAPYYADFYLGSTFARFDRDLAVLKEHFEFVSLADVIRENGPRRESSRPLLALTFDDGFDAVGSGVMDVLDRHAIRATTFVITSMVGNHNLMWRNKLAAIRTLRDEHVYVPRYNDLMAKVALPAIARGDDLLSSSRGWPMSRKDELVDALWDACGMPALDEFLGEHQPYFTWDGLKQWLASGHGVGLHTATHPFCSRLGPAEIRTEVEEPAALLRSTLNLRFLPFSYPFGVRLDQAAERQLYEHGVFDCAFGIEGFVPRGTPGYRLERASIEGDFTFSVFGSVLLGSARRSSSRTPSRASQGYETSIAG